MSHCFYSPSDEKTPPPIYITEHFSFLTYEILLLEAIHTMVVSLKGQDKAFYVPCTRSEFIILLRLLRAPMGYAVPFEELHPHLPTPANESLVPLQRHMSRLKKKLPSHWHIVCEVGFGYRLHVEELSDDP